MASRQEVSMLTGESMASGFTKEDITKSTAMADITSEDTIMAGTRIEGTTTGGTILENTSTDAIIMESAIIDDTTDIPLRTGATPVGCSDSHSVAYSNQGGTYLNGCSCPAFDPADDSDKGINLDF